MKLDEIKFTNLKKKLNFHQGSSKLLPKCHGQFGALMQDWPQCFTGNFEDPWWKFNFSSNLKPLNYSISYSITLIMVAICKGIDSVLGACEL